MQMGALELIHMWENANVAISAPFLHPHLPDEPSESPLVHFNTTCVREQSELNRLDMDVMLSIWSVIRLRVTSGCALGVLASASQRGSCESSERVKEMRYGCLVSNMERHTTSEYL